MNPIRLIKPLVLIYALVAILIFTFQRSLIYQPTAEIAHNFTTLELTTHDNQVEALVTNEQAHGVILYFGGNAENVAYSAADFSHEFPNHSTYLLKYRGYSGAQGSASEANLFADALALFDHIKQHNKRVTVIGRSLGSGVATFLATERSVDKLVLVTPFDSIRNVAQSMLPMFPVAWLLKDHFDSKSRATQITAPTLVVVASEDQVIPKSHTHSLIQSIPQNHLITKTIIAGHNDLDLYPVYYSAIKDFINN